jgi:hypothetical protein
MSYDPTIAALSFGNAKAAALYFTRVLPVAFASLRGDKGGLYLEVPDHVPVEVAVKLIFDEDAPKHLILSYLDDYWAPFMRRLRPLMTDPKSSTEPGAYEELKNLYLSNAGTATGHSVRDLFRDFANDLGIDKYSVLLPEQNPSGADFAETYAYLALSAVSLIDTSKASWDQMCPFGKAA